jgi:tetratricopeptide (TPR) repeat protein
MSTPIEESQRAVTLGISTIQKLRTFVGRGAKVSAPITMICGAIADLASTIGKFSLYILIGSLCLAVVSGAMWFFRYRRQFIKAAADGVLQPAEVEELGERNAWSVTFAFSVVAAVVMGGFVVADRMAGEEDKGVLASTIPGMDKIQQSLFRVEKKLDAVQATTNSIAADTAALRVESAAASASTAKIAASIEDIAKRFETIASTGGVIAAPKTPEEHYHNARVHELGGNFTAARKAYSEHLSSDLDLLDAWLNFAALLKVQEGREGAKEALQFFSARGQKSTSLAIAKAMLEEREARLAALQKLASENPKFGPLAWLVAREFSEEKVSAPTLAEKKLEKEWLEKFKEAHAAGNVLRFALDKREAQKWLDTAEVRMTALAATPAQVMENPVTLTAQESNAGWAVNLALADFRAKEIFFRLDGKGEFQTTGHLPNQNPQTGLPMPNVHIPLPGLAPGEHSIEVKYTDKNDVVNGPFTLKFSTASEQLAQGKMMLNTTIGSWLMFRDFDGKLLLYFTQLMSFRPVIKEIRYSLDSEALDKTFPFKPTEKMYEVEGTPYLSVPKGTQFAAVQVTYKDGTKSAVQKFARQK